MSEEAAKEEKPDHTVPRMTDDELKEFVLGMCDGRLFTSEHVRQLDMVPIVFMPIALGFGEWPREVVDQIGVFWEWMSKAGPRSVNGMPMFMSMNIMHKEDWKRARVAYDAEMARRKDIEV